MGTTHRTEAETLELLDFMCKLKKRFSRTATPPNLVGPAYGVPMEMEKEYAVKMTSCGPNKVQIVKWLRSNKKPALSLAEAAAIAGMSGSIVESHLTKPAAIELKEELEKIGAIVEMIEE